MVNTVSITAELAPAVLSTMQDNIGADLMSGKSVVRTVSMGHRSSLSDAEVAVAFAAVVEWNAGTSTATSIEQLWDNVALKLTYKWQAEQLRTWWRQLCEANPHSQLITNIITSVNLICAEKITYAMLNNGCFGGF